MSHKTPVSIISRANYRITHNVSLSADDEWLIKDAVSCVIDLVKEIEELKEQVAIYKDQRDEWISYHDTIVKDCRMWREDAQKFHGVLQQIADYHGTTDEVWSNSMKSLAREAMADRLLF